MAGRVGTASRGAPYSLQVLADFVQALRGERAFAHSDVHAGGYEDAMMEAVMLAVVIVAMVLVMAVMPRVGRGTLWCMPWRRRAPDKTSACTSDRKRDGRLGAGSACILDGATIGLNHIRQTARGNAEACGGASYAAAGGGNVGIGAKVDVKHQSVGALNHHFLAG